MEDDENRAEQLVNNGKVPENSLVDPEIEYRHATNSYPPISYDQNQGETRAPDDKSDDGKAGDEILVQNGEEGRNLTNSEPHELLMKDKDDQVGKEQSVDVPDQHDNDEQSDSERTEVEENGIEGVVSIVKKEDDPATPSSIRRCSNEKDEHDDKGLTDNWLESEITEDDEDGSPEEQKAFMKELQCFYREKAMEFKPPRFYQQPLNCLKLWRAVIKLGGYDLVTAQKYWRQIGESFHPPKTCTTVSWTFRSIYEKALLEYERYKCQNGDLQFSAGPLPKSSSTDNNGNGYQGPGLSARTRRDSTPCAMQGSHVQKLSGNGEAGGEFVVKDKNFNDMPRREKSLKSIGSVKHKRPTEIDHTIKAARTELGKQLVITVEDAGPPADWVKINVCEAKDCFEVYALVPGLLREEVRVQSDPAGRLVITGQPEQPDNPWGITPFRKVVNFPARIDPLQTSAVVSLHGRLYVRVPFEESDICI